MEAATFCPRCGREYGVGANFCSACGAQAVPADPYRRTRLVRPRHPRMIAGVCSGVAIHYGWDISLARILFAVFVCLTGVGLFVYLAAWIVIPDAPYALPPVTYAGTAGVPPPGY